MLHVQSTSIIAIDHKWVALLVGLCMKVPNDWWPYVSGQTLNTGVIAGVNFDINTNNHIQLELEIIIITQCFVFNPHPSLPLTTNGWHC
jgi:hypothetical protein